MQIFGMDIFYFINWFFVFSFFGYVLECIVVSLEYKRPILNRGFTHGPFCIIYGFGAIGAYIFLVPFTSNLVFLFVASSLLATTMELVTAYVMIKIFGSFWWDYSKKPCNYKGIICLESSIGWGFLGIIFFYFLDSFMKNLVGQIPSMFSKIIAISLLIFYTIDFIYSMYKHLTRPEDSSDTVGRLKVS